MNKICQQTMRAMGLERFPEFFTDLPTIDEGAIPADIAGPVIMLLPPLRSIAITVAARAPRPRLG